MRTHLRQAEAWIWFTGDEPLAAGGFDQDTANKLAKEFEFLEIGAGPRVDQQVWIANRGSMKVRRDAKEKIKIVSARGVESDLSVEVEGDSEDAHRALDAIWKCLAGSGATSVDSMGKIYYRTVMIVEFPLDYDAVFPAAALTRRFVAERLKQHDGREPREPQHRMAIEFTSDVGRRPILRAVRFEPRHTSSSGHTIFTESPLHSDEHMAWLEAIAQSQRAS
jgi:hypothetical protein